MDNPDFLNDLQKEIRRKTINFLSEVDTRFIDPTDYDFIEEVSQKTIKENIEDYKSSVDLMLVFKPNSNELTMLKKILHGLKPQYKIGGYQYNDVINSCAKCFDKDLSLKEVIEDYDLDFVIRKKLESMGFKNLDEYLEKNYNSKIPILVKEKNSLKTNDKFGDYPEIILQYNKLNKKIFDLL